MSWAHHRECKYDVPILRVLICSCPHCRAAHSLLTPCSLTAHSPHHNLPQDFWRKHAAPRTLSGRNALLRSVCPQLAGLMPVKLAMCLALAGGVAQPAAKLRGDVHLLMIGDPGMGESH